LTCAKNADELIDWVQEAFKASFRIRAKSSGDVKETVLLFSLLLRTNRVSSFIAATAMNEDFEVPAGGCEYLNNQSVALLV
jgi:hypothetical protein